MASILTTGCHELLPDFVKPYFTSKTFTPLPGSSPIPLWAAILPPATYFLALFLLSAGDESGRDSRRPPPLVILAKYLLAAVSAASFFTLPFLFHVPGSAIFTYQLGLIGCFGSARVLDIFFLSRPRTPKRISVPQPDHQARSLRRPHRGHEHEEQKLWRGAPVYPPGTDNLEWKVEETPTTLGGRLWWALDLMISMRGIGWDFASADVRHDISPWQPPSSRQVKLALFRLLPALMVAAFVTRHLLARLGHPLDAPLLHTSPSIVDLPPTLRPVLVLATGVSLYTLFDAGYTLVSAIALPVLEGVSRSKRVKLHNVDFFPLLNPLKLPEITSVRGFWSKAWHRLFHRAFLIFGILPFQNLALFLFPRAGAPILDFTGHPDPARLLPKGTHDWAKVLGAFFASGMVHAISERAALGGRVALPDNNFWLRAGFSSFDGSSRPVHLKSAAGLPGHEVSGPWSVSRVVPPFSGAGEFTFFMLNGLAVLFEGAVWNVVKTYRKRALLERRRRERDHRQSPGDGKLSPGRQEELEAERLLASEEESDDGIKRSGSPPLSSAAGSASEEVSDADLTRWYDRYIGLVWAVWVLLETGQAFVDGWVKSGILAELTFYPH
ncbi:unnamed protein product [Parajaminaea phylloscopi]